MMRSWRTARGFGSGVGMGSVVETSPRSNWVKRRANPPASGREERRMAKKKAAGLTPKLTEAEQDLLSHIQDGYELETDSLGGNPVLVRLKDNEEIRPLSANRNTVKALERRGLITPGKGRDLLTIGWSLKRK